MFDVLCFWKLLLLVWIVILDVDIYFVRVFDLVVFWVLFLDVEFFVVFIVGLLIFLIESGVLISIFCLDDFEFECIKLSVVFFIIFEFDCNLVLFLLYIMLIGVLSFICFDFIELFCLYCIFGVDMVDCKFVL